jgi:hypothetical protein
LDETHEPLVFALEDNEWPLSHTLVFFGMDEKIAHIALNNNHSLIWH